MTPVMLLAAALTSIEPPDLRVGEATTQSVIAGAAGAVAQSVVAQVGDEVRWRIRDRMTDRLLRKSSRGLLVRKMRERQAKLRTTMKMRRDLRLKRFDLRGLRVERGPI